jgi:LPXTG-motif cell wall-anchored protein
VGQTQVVSTVEEVADDGTVLQSRPLTFTLAVAPNPANPFTVTTPYVTETIDSATPTFTGTGEPGAEIVITYGARSLTTAEAGRGIVDAQGNFSIVTDFSRLEPGAGTEAQGGVGAIFTQTLNGEPVPGADQQSILFYFAEAPVPLIPLTLTVDPTSLTVADVTDADKGVEVTATGFSPNEGLTATLTGPDGAVVELSGAGSLFADDEDGSFADRLTLTGDVLTGDYTLTLSGNRSGRVISTEFTVVANPVTPVTPGGNGGNTVPAGTGTAATGSGQLAKTGVDAAPLGALAGGLLLAGLVVAVLRRRAQA